MGAIVRVHETRILIVEDEELIAAEIKSILEGMGASIVDVAVSATEALEKVESDKPDLVLLDLSFGGRFEGVEVARIINERWKLPVILISGHLGDAAAVGLSEIEMAGYIAKPFHPFNLREAVEAALR